MQLVDDRWYKFYVGVTTTVQILLVAACLATLFVPSLNQYFNQYGLTYITLALGIMHLVYVMLIYPKHYRNDPFVATMVVSAIYTLNVVNLIQVTGQLRSPYMALWAILTLLSGTYGAYAIAGTGFLITLYFVMLQTEHLSTTGIDIPELIALGGSYALCLISWLLYRGAYIDTESMQVKQLSGQLRNKQRQSEILIQSITDGIILIDTQGVIGLINPAAATMTEWSVDEAIGIDIHMVTNLQQEDGRELPDAENPFTKVLTNKEQMNQSLSLVGRNGKSQIVSLSVAPVLIGENKELAGAVAVIRDISAARMEEQRRADFISTASHEMRTPVAAIEGYLALALNDSVSKIDTKARNYLEKAHASTQHLGNLFQDLLTSAKAEDGRLVSHPVVIEMGEYLEQISDSLRFAAEKKGLLIEYSVGVSKSKENATGGDRMVRPLYYAHADPDRLREVITNLFDNAVKYTEKGKVTLGLTGNEEVVQVYIKDTGIGIPAEDIPHMFQKFYRVDSSATRSIGGTGLGLFICRKIVEMYKGRIWVESEVGKGSTFYINLPRISTQKASEMKLQETKQN